MAIVRFMVGVVGCSIAASLVSLVGCSGSNDGSVFDGGSDMDAAPAPVFDAGTFAPDDPTEDAGPTSCAPISTGTFTPTWKQPAPFAQGACSDVQMDGFYTACLNPPVNPSTCDNFVQANAACAKCLQSDDTDTNQGPVLWHSSHAYYTMNLPGCIANAEQNLAPTGCGAAYQAALECKQSECSACFTPTSGSFTNFVACEQAAGKGDCATYNTQLHNACGDALHAAAASAAECIPATSATALDVYHRIAPLFCGGATK